MRPLWTLFLCHFFMALDLRMGNWSLSTQVGKRDGGVFTRLWVSEYSPCDEEGKEIAKHNFIDVGGRSDHLVDTFNHLSDRPQVDRKIDKLDKDHKDYHKPTLILSNS